MPFFPLAARGGIHRVRAFTRSEGSGKSRAVDGGADSVPIPLPLLNADDPDCGLGMSTRVGFVVVDVEEHEVMTGGGRLC